MSWTIVTAFAVTESITKVAMKAEVFQGIEGGRVVEMFGEAATLLR
jgi:hypothetical protein